MNSGQEEAACALHTHGEDSQIEQAHEVYRFTTVPSRFGLYIEHQATEFGVSSKKLVPQFEFGMLPETLKARRRFLSQVEFQPAKLSEERLLAVRQLVVAGNRSAERPKSVVELEATEPQRGLLFPRVNLGVFNCCHREWWVSFVSGVFRCAARLDQALCGEHTEGRTRLVSACWRSIELVQDRKERRRGFLGDAHNLLEVRSVVTEQLGQKRLGSKFWLVAPQCSQVAEERQIVHARASGAILGHEREFQF
mmetsp:Transcript_9967/g.25708  ORF Transcript_9967/g.25708 Transcript_9967/m.25708 type:complete len:252 (+) Transcript_9967:1196-1951(+)